jgi:hypothetical protein
MKRPANSNTTTHQRSRVRAMSPLCQRSAVDASTLTSGSNTFSTGLKTSGRHPALALLLAAARYALSCSYDLSILLFNLQLVGPLMSIGAIWFLSKLLCLTASLFHQTFSAAGEPTPLHLLTRQYHFTNTAREIWYRRVSRHFVPRIRPAAMRASSVC